MDHFIPMCNLATLLMDSSHGNIALLPSRRPARLHLSQSSQRCHCTKFPIKLLHLGYNGQRRCNATRIQPRWEGKEES